MAAMNAATNTFINVPKPSSFSKQCLSQRNKFSRVSFTSSASNNGFNETVDRAAEMYKGAKVSTGEGIDSTNKQALEAAEKSKGIAVDLKDSAVDSAQGAKEKVMDAAGAAGDNISQGAEKAKEAAFELKDKASDMAGSVADKTKEAVDGAWEATKDAAQKLQETVEDLNK